jgi:hypothetical protein
MSKRNPVQEISKLQQRIEQLKEAAVGELKDRRLVLEADLKSIDCQLEALIGKSARRKSTDTPASRSVTF